VNLLCFCYAEKSQNLVIFVVLTVFGVCGVGVLTLLRSRLTNDDDNNDSEVYDRASVFYITCFVPFLP